MDHIINDIRGWLRDDEWLDGEIYQKDMAFENITGSYHTGEVKLPFHVFDVFTVGKDETFYERFKRVTSLPKSQWIHVVPTIFAKGSELKMIHESNVREGWEGTMIRNPKGSYGIDKRSWDLMKLKDFETQEYTIVDCQEGVGREQGAAIWVCETMDKIRFSVRPKGTLEQRKEWFQNRNMFMGKPLTVQFQELTKKRVPRFPVGVVVRDYE